MRKIILSLLVAAIVFPAASYGEGNSGLHTGNDLLKACEALIEGPESISNSSLQAKLDWLSESEYCYAYIKGVVEWNGYYEKWLESVPIKPIFCLGENQFEIDQLAEIAIKYMKDHPEELNEKGIAVLNSAFSQQFSCAAN